MVPYHGKNSLTTQLGQKRWKKWYKISKSAKNLQNFDFFHIFLDVFPIFLNIFLTFSQFFRHILRVSRFCIDIMKKNWFQHVKFLFCLIYILMLGKYDPRGSRFKNPWTHSNQTLKLASFSYSLPKIGLSMEAHTVYYLIWGKTPSMQLK